MGWHGNEYVKPFEKTMSLLAFSWEEAKGELHCTTHSQTSKNPLSDSSPPHLSPTATVPLSFSSLALLWSSAWSTSPTTSAFTFPSFSGRRLQLVPDFCRRTLSSISQTTEPAKNPATGSQTVDKDWNGTYFEFFSFHASFNTSFNFLDVFPRSTRYTYSL